MPLEDYIIHVFCLIDDLYQDLLLSCKVRKSGYSPILADSEIISMLVIGEFLGFSDNKKIWLYFKSHYLAYFPTLDYVRYKIFNKQATCLWYVIRIIHSKLLTKIGEWNLYLADGIPFPICHLARANRSKLFKDKVVRHYCAAKKNTTMALKFC